MDPINSLSKTDGQLGYEAGHLLVKLFEALPDALIIKDAQGRWQVANSTAIQLLQLEEVPWQDKTDLELATLCPALNDIFEDCYVTNETSWQSGQKSVRVRPIPDRSGSLHFVEFRKIPLFDASSSPQMLIVIGRDVTAAFQGEEALRQSEERLRTLINAMPDIVCFKDGEGRWLEANDADRRLFQIEHVDYRGKKDSELAEYSSFYRQAFLTCEDTDERAWQRGGLSRGEEIIPRPDGSETVLEIIKVPLFNADTSRKGLVVLGRDITERKQAENTLRESEQKFRGIVEQSKEMEAALRQRAEELAALHTISLSINAAHDLPGLLNIMIERAVRLLEADGGGFYLCNAENQTITCAVSYQMGRDYTGMVVKYGHGAAGWVAQTGQSLIIEDYSSWWGRSPLFDQPEKPVRAMVATPIQWQEQVTGVIYATNFDPGRRFSPEDLELLTLFANQAAIAIENARLLEAERLRRQEAENLRQATAAVTATLDLNQVLERILNYLQQVVAYDSATVFLLEGDHLRATAGRCLVRPDLVMGMVFPADDALFIEIQRNARPLILSDAQAHPSFNRWGETEWVRSWMGIPLVLHNKVIGYLTCDSRQVGTYNLNHARVAQAFANQAAIAIENARLFEQAATERRHLALLNDINRAIATSLDADDILGRVLNMTCQTLHGLMGEAFLYLPEKNVLSLRSIYGKPDGLVAELGLSLKVGVGLAGWVARSALSANVPEVTIDSRWLKVPGLDEDVHTAMSAPIQAGDRLMGVITVMHHLPNAFTNDHLTLLETICRECGLALSNASRYRQVQRRLAEITLIQSLAQTFTQRLELQVLLDEVVTQLAKRLGYHQVEILLKEDNFLTVRSFYGQVPFFKTTPLSQGICGKVVRTGQIIFQPDVRQDVDYIDSVHSTVAELAVPLYRGEEVIGVLNIESEQYDQLSIQDRDLLQVLGDQISVAVENAILYERVRRHAEELEQTVAQRTAELTELYKLSQEIAYQLTYDGLLRLLLNHLRSASRSEIVMGYLELADYRSLLIETNRPIGPSILVEARTRWIEALTADNGRVTSVSERFPIEILPGDDFNPSNPPLEKIAAMIHAPVYYEHKLVGGLIVASEQFSTFGAEQVRLLNTFANQATAALQRLAVIFSAQQKNLESLVEHMPVGTLLLDNDFNLLVGNPLGREIFSLVNANQPESAQSGLGPYSFMTLIQHQNDPLPLEITHPGPPQRIFAAQVRPVGDGQRRWVLTLREITQERENQARIQSQERLATVGQLAAGIAHDFNNIMAAILVYADLLRRDPNLPTASREKLSIIQQQVQRAASLIRQILDFSRRSIMEQSALDLLPFTKELDKMLGRILPETIRLELTYQPGSFWVNADPTRLQQAFMNLVVNARDAMPAGGTLRFALDHLEYSGGLPAPIPEMPPGRWIRIAISDTGVGITPEMCEHIFEPFFTTKPVGQGTGLGLAQVYGIIKQHDGFIDFHSQVGEGTTFTIYLPAIPAPQAAQPALDATDHLSGDGETVLIVEDDPATRQALQALMEALNFTVLTASNGIEALMQFEQRQVPVSLVISDVVMPHMGGVALYKTLKKRWPDLKMLFITGHPVEESNQELLETGSVHWLQKPFSVQEFKRALQALV